MKLHDWNPAWYQPGESVWSVANKLAFVAAASVADVFEDLAGVPRRAREAWLFPQPEQAAAILSSLQLPEGLGNRLFANTTGLHDLTERFHWQLAIRYCPQCLEGFVHRVAFQDLRVEKCPVHACPLTDLCPFCRSPLDPLCPQAWTCADCGNTLIEPGVGWPAMFRSARGGRIRAQQAPVSARPMPAWGAYVDRRRLVQDAYEEHSALCSALLGRHHDCLPGEVQAYSMTRPPVLFDCPLAAGALFLAGQLGFVAQCADGVWIPARPFAAPGLKDMEAVLGTVPEVQHQEAARSITRTWFAEVVETFNRAAAAGEQSAVWIPRAQPWLDGQRHLNSPISADDLCSLAAHASRNCRAAGIKSIPHCDM
jgi:hypothetical protein